MKLKRHFYNHKDYTIDKVNKVVILSPDFHQKLLQKSLWGKFGFKKIGGSSIGDVLEVDSWKSPFAAFCRMSWIGLPILDRKYVDAGIAIEHKVIDVVERTSGKKVTTFDPAKYNYDYFANVEVVGGLPDGYIEESKTVLEIKTTGEKNFEKWREWGVPIGYLKQAQLYAFLMDVDRFSIVATFLKEEDYLDPSAFPIKERKIKNWNFIVVREQAQDDINKVKAWYHKYTTLGSSPTYQSNVDQDLLDWLEISTPEEEIALEERWIQEGKLII